VEKIVNLLKKYNLTLSCAESLTGGSFASTVTNVPGASSIFKGGIVSYTNEIKANVLNVKQDTLDTFGAVSKQCCYEMAQNIKTIFNSDIGVSFTGNAGPSASENKRLVIVEGASHAMAYVDDRQTVTNAMIEFLNSVIK